MSSRSALSAVAAQDSQGNGYDDIAGSLDELSSGGRGLDDFPQLSPGGGSLIAELRRPIGKGGGSAPAAVISADEFVQENQGPRFPLTRRRRRPGHAGSGWSGCPAPLVIGLTGV